MTSSGTYVPDVGDTFEVTQEWSYRKWQWLPFPWRRRRVITDTHSYRVTGWLKRRPAPPEPSTEHERMAREIIQELLAEEKIDAPRGHGPDRVPLMFCRREEAEYVGGYGIGGTIERVTDVRVTGRVSWPEEHIQDERDQANLMAGEPLL